ncbi:MAG: TonB-dependent receptor [Candidatus Eremiobacteraeota bacterium]|nr:TonB-dependent receptor [Candidatus Eremiobacteraeota bacterium]
MFHTLLGVCCLIVGGVHTPSGAPIAQASVLISGPTSRRTQSDAKGGFSLIVPPGRYDLSASARGYASVTVNTGDIVRDSHIDVVLEPANSPKLRTIGQVTVNGSIVLDRNVIPEVSVSRTQMDALGYTGVLDALQEVPSVVIHRTDSGAPSTPAVVSLRGPDPSEAMVTLDGQQLNDGNTGDLDISQFLVPAFSSVNVSEGLGPTDLEGSNTFGGAVNFVSLRPTQEQHASLSGSLGSYDTSQSWLNATGTLGKLGYALAGDSFQSGGQVNQEALVYPFSDAPRNCTSGSAANCPFLAHLGSTISARLGLVNLDYNFSQRADAGFRVFTLGNVRDESSALNGIAGNAYCSFPGGPSDLPACTFPAPSPGATAAPNPVYGQHIGTGDATFAQSVRAYEGYSRSVLGAGTLVASLYAGDDNVDFQGGAISPYDVVHADKRYNEGLSWGRAFDGGEFSFGGYARQESLTGVGIAGSVSQSINSYFARGAQQFGNLRLSAGLYDAHYSTFGNNVDWRLGASYDIGRSTDVHASAGTGFRAPLLIERYYYPPVIVDGKLQPNPGLPPMDSNCVVPGQGNPAEQPEHATEYELGISHLFSTYSDLDVSLYRSNLRDTIENYYPGGGAESFCGKNSPNGFVYEIPINIGNAVYEGTEVRFKQIFPRQHLAAVLSYGLNVAFPYALGPFVSNPTSGGTLVDYEQFLQVPQQQGSAALSWGDGGWHAATAFTFAGKNNTLNQSAYTTVDAAVGKTWGPADFTIAATNVFNAVSGPFTYIASGVPYPGLAPAHQVDTGLPTNRLFVQPAAIRFVLTVKT